MVTHGVTFQCIRDSIPDVCEFRAMADGSTLLGADVDLEFPIIDISDASIEKVYLQFDMLHIYDGNGLRNSLTDSVSYDSWLMTCGIWENT